MNREIPSTGVGALDKLFKQTLVLLFSFVSFLFDHQDL